VCLPVNRLSYCIPLVQGLNLESSILQSKVTGKVTLTLGITLKLNSTQLDCVVSLKFIELPLQSDTPVISVITRFVLIRGVAAFVVVVVVVDLVSLGVRLLANGLSVIGNADAVGKFALRIGVIVPAISINIVSDITVSSPNINSTPRGGYLIIAEQIKYMFLTNTSISKCIIKEFQHIITVYVNSKIFMEDLSLYLKCISSPCYLHLERGQPILCMFQSTILFYTREIVIKTLSSILNIYCIFFDDTFSYEECMW
jgi:hypothetical protein